MAFANFNGDYEDDTMVDITKDYESDDKAVSHPNYYMLENGMQVIDIQAGVTFDLKGIECICTANAIKYISRWKGKNGIQDLEKAMWYIQHLINHLRKLEKENKNER